MGEEVHGLAGLALRLLADAAGVAPVEGEVLPDQHPGLVGRRVQLRPADVGVEAEQVEDVCEQLAAQGGGPAGVTDAAEPGPVDAADGGHPRLRDRRVAGAAGLVAAAYVCACSSPAAAKR